VLSAFIISSNANGFGPHFFPFDYNADGNARSMHRSRQRFFETANAGFLGGFAATLRDHIRETDSAACCSVLTLCGNAGSAYKRSTPLQFLITHFPRKFRQGQHK
jgi:hypothetical protein